MTERRKHPGIITDAEIKEIKEGQIDPRIEQCYLNTWINTVHLKAIIERLECSERINLRHHPCRCDDCCDLHKAWRTSRGE